VHWQLATLAAIVLAYAAVSRRLDGAPITAAMVFTAVGPLVGSTCSGSSTATPTVSW
jgi:sodium/hydrogen antiporter